MRSPIQCAPHNARDYPTQDPLAVHGRRPSVFHDGVSHILGLFCGGRLAQFDARFRQPRVVRVGIQVFQVSVD